MILRSFFFAFPSVSLFPSAPAPAEPVDLQLVLAVDVSGSMDDEEQVPRSRIDCGTCEDLRRRLFEE